MRTLGSVNPEAASNISFILPLVFYLHKLHHGDRVEEVEAAESVQPVGGAGDVGDGQ